MVAITVDPVEGVACPRADVTVTGLLPGAQVVTVWRTTDGEREAVRGARTITVTDSFYVPDFAVPLGRLVSYELEVISGADAGMQGVTADVVVNSDSGFIQDPLDPSSVVPIHGDRHQSETTVGAASFGVIQYNAPVSVFRVQGSRLPVSIAGTRGGPTGVPIMFSTHDKGENRRLRDLLAGSVHLIIRPLPGWGDFILPAATYAAASVEEQPVNVSYGGNLTRWVTTGDVVRPSSARVVVPLHTFGDVMEVHTGTFGDKLAAAGGGTFLDDLKNPFKL